MAKRTGRTELTGIGSSGILVLQFISSFAIAFGEVSQISPHRREPLQKCVEVFFGRT